ncbi:MAG: ABC transporter permease [Promethearchaeota archaeon]
MSILDTKVFREIRFHKFRSLTIVTIVAITLALLTGMRASYPMVYNTLDKNLIENNVADGRYTFTSPIMENNITEIENDQTFLSESKIDQIEGRIFLPTELTYNGNIFPAIVIGINYPNEINKIYIEQKADEIHSNSDFFKDNMSCIIETRFAGDLLGQNVKMHDNLTINFGGSSNLDFSVKGIAEDSDFLYVVDPVSGMALMGQMAVVWVDLSTLQNILFYGLPLINQVLFTVDERLNKNMTNLASDKLFTRFIENNIDMSSSQFELFDETVDRKFFDADAGSIDKMGTIFGLIGIIICSVVIFNTLNRMVQSQNKNIGLFLAMGSSRKKIISHYVKITMILTLIGIVIGIPLGYYLSVGMTKMIVAMYSIHYLDFSLAYMEFLYGAIALLLVSLIFSIISAYPITNVTPQEAMHMVFNRIKITSKTFSEKIFGWIPIFRSIHMYIPLREIFLRKKRTVFTILALTTSMIMLINSAAMEYNMYAEITDNFEKYNAADVAIILENPIPINEINSFMTNQSNDQIVHSEVYLDLYTKIIYKGEFLTWTELQCFQSNSTLRNFNVISGIGEDKTELNSNKIILGQSLAGKYDIKLNDHIEIGQTENFSIQVGGFTGEMIDYSALWTLEAFGTGNISVYYNVPKGFVNGILLDVKDGANMTELRDIFDEQFQISQWTESETSKNSVMTLMNAMLGILLIFLLIGVVIGVMFSFSSMYLAFIDRENDFLALKAMGTKNKYMRGIIFWENVFLSAFSMILTIPLGYLSFRWSLSYMMENKYYIPLTIPWFIWIFVFILSMLSIGLATGRLMRKIRKMDLADELRQRMIS